MTAPVLDRADRKILDLLERDGRLANVDLAGKIALGHLGT